MKRYVSRKHVWSKALQALAVAGLLLSSFAQAATWTLDTPGTLTSGRAIRNFWGTSATNVYAVGGATSSPGLFYRWDGSSWSEPAASEFSTFAMRGIIGFSATEVWVAGRFGNAKQSTDSGSTWTNRNSGLSSTFTPYGMWGAVNTDIWLVGVETNTGSAAIYRWNGSTWTLVTGHGFGTQQLMSVWGTSANNVVMVATGGLIARWDGTQLNMETSGTSNALLNVWGLDANNIFATGNSSTILRYNGSNWAPFSATGITGAVAVNGITGSSASNLYIATGDGSNHVYHWDGSSWTRENTGYSNSMNAIWSNSTGSNIWAGGAVQLIAGTVSVVAAPTVTSATQSSVTHDSATLGGNVTADGGAAVSERGIVWATSATPTTSNNKVQIGSGTGAFSQSVSGLPSSTLIYVRAYAINSAGTAYGSQISFTTSAAPAPEIAVAFAGNVVADGSASPATLNGTDFGSLPVAGVTQDHVFTITNSGTAALTLGTVSATGDFAVQTQPAGTVAAGGGTTTFTIRFDPSGTGLRTGTVSFSTNDSDENPFNFSVQGTGSGPQTFDLAGNALSNSPYDGGETYIFTTNSAPTDITLTPASLAENNTAGDAVGTLDAVDADLADTHVFALVAGAGDTDNDSFTINGDSLELDEAADYEVKSSYSLRVRATDSGAGNLAFEKVLTVTITDANDAPALTNSLLVYETTNPVRVANDIQYAVNNAAALAGVPFNRVRYRMQTTVGGVVRYADVSFDAWPGLTVQGLRVPTPNDPFVVQRNVDNLSVESNYAGVVNASAQTGRLEIWNYNYGPEADNGIGGSNVQYDFDDRSAGTDSYGSFQVHNLSSVPKQTVLAWNNHGVATPDVGFGNRLTGDPDWTFSGVNGLGTDGWKLQIYIEGPSETASVQVAENSTAVKVMGAVDADQPAQSFTYSLDGGADESLFSIDPGTGALAFLSAPDFENPADADTDNVYEVIVQITDNGTPARSGTQTLQITVTDAAEPPVIARDNASVTVHEGAAAANTGTFSDVEGNASVTLSASVGSVIANNAAGTWSWSHTPADGPGDSQTVTITADDGVSAPVATTFSLVVNNATPSYELGLPDPLFLTPGSGDFSRTISFTDAGADVWSGTVNYGAGGGSGALSVNQGARSFSLSHTYTLGGRYTVTTSLQDDEAASQGDSMEVDVILTPILVTGSATAVTPYTATLHGTVNANHGTTTVWFEYSPDATMTEGVLSTAGQSAGSGTSAQAAQANVEELLADSAYYFRIVAENEAGIRRGNIQSFSSDPPIVTDQPLVDAAGVPQGDIYRPMPGVINGAGRIAFKAYGIVGTGTITSASNVFLMADVTGSMQAVARMGTEVEAGQGLSGIFYDYLLTDDGLTVIHDKINGAAPTADVAHLAAAAGQSLEVISREGDAAPDGGTFSGHTGKPALDADGRIYFGSNLTGVAANRNTGLWVDDAGVLSLRLIEGSDVSSVTGDPAWLGNISNVIAAGGDGVLVNAMLQNNPDDSSQKTLAAKNEVVLVSDADGLRLVARKGDSVPDSPSTFSSFTALSRASGDHHAFLGLMARTGGVTTADDQVLVAEVAGTLHLVAREGVTVLDGGLTPKTFGDFAVTSTGAVIFRAKLDGAAADTADVLYRWTVAGGLELLARTGSSAPGTAETFGILQVHSVSDGGAIALTAVLSDGNTRLFRALPSGPLTSLVAAGDTVSVGGAPRSIYSLSIFSDGSGTGGGCGGMGAAINDLGEIFTVLSIGSGEYVARIYR